MKEAEIYFNFLIQIAAADNELDEAEVEFIAESVEAIELADDVKDRVLKQLERLKNSQKINSLEQIFSELKKTPNPSLVMTMLRDGYTMATVDGHPCESEIAVLRSLISSVGNPSNELHIQAIEWAKESLKVKIKGEKLFNDLRIAS